MNASILTAVALVVLAYVAGSVASAVIVSRLMKLPDPRDEGSRNPGATNVLRLGGKKAAALTLAGDLLKGLLPVLLARSVTDAVPVLAATAFAALLGHVYPVFFRFRGGKGVATAFGAVLGLVWPVALAMLMTWLVVAVASRYSSLAALTAAALSPFYTALLAPEPALIACLTAMCILIVWRHRSNIRNLLTGSEDKIGAKP